MQASEKYATAPAVAIESALLKAGLELEETKVFEINEASSVRVNAVKADKPNPRSRK